jgi:hypothetical protein
MGRTGKNTTEKLYNSKSLRTFAAEYNSIMKFEELVKNKLWAIRGDDEDCHALEILLDHWNDVIWLNTFFMENQIDLLSYYSVSIEEAIMHTIEDSDKLESLMLRLAEDDDLDRLFRPLDNNETGSSLLQKDKARLKDRPRHSSWLRIYAIRLSNGAYIITGGAIKLTRTMEEREHTQAELDKIEKVRNYLLSEHIIDDESFIDYIAEL